MMTKVATAVVDTRTMQPSDLNAVLAIEENNGPKSNPMGGAWTKEDFCSVLQAANHAGLLVTVTQNRRTKIVGFAIYCMMPDKIHVCNLAIHKDYERRGLASLMIGKLKDKLRPGKRTSLEFDIRESNLHAQLYLKKQGFRAISVIRNWYEHPEREDAYKFQYKLPESAESLKEKDYEFHRK
jgi:ribosomal-protein-alanine N-acetyltransferase